MTIIINQILKIIFLIMVISITIASCKSAKERYNTLIEQQLKNNAFKNGDSINILELQVLTIDTTNMRKIDSIRLSAAEDSIGSCFDRLRHLREKRFPLTIKRMDSYDRNDLMGINDADAQITEIDEQISENAKPFKFFGDIRTELDERLRYSRVQPEVVYSVKAYLKAIKIQKNTSENVLDTFYYHFNKNGDYISTALTVRKR